MSDLSEKVEFHHSRGKLAALACICLLGKLILLSLEVFGGAMAMKMEGSGGLFTQLTFLALIVTTIGALLIVICRFVRARNPFLITREGFRDPKFSHDLVPWQRVEEVLNGNPKNGSERFIGVKLRRWGSYKREMGLFSFGLLLLTQLYTPKGFLVLGHRVLKVSRDELYETMVAYYKAWQESVEGHTQI